MASFSSDQERLTREYLHLLLSQQGSQALPYDEAVKSLILRHLLTLTRDFPSLLVQSASFTHNDGTTIDLLQASGTIPMTHQGTLDYIPVTIWLVEDYPVASPLVLVSPKADMVIKHHHQHVDGSGYVSLPYLSNWKYPQSNLLDLARSLSSMFGRDPPLICRSTRSASPAFSSYDSTRYEDETKPTRTQTFFTQDPSEVFRHNATNALAERIKLEISELKKASAADIDMLRKTQMQLQRRQTRLNEAIKTLLLEREGLEQQLQILGTNTDVIQIWLCNHRHVVAPTTIHIDDAFEPCNPLSRQMLECMSGDKALEDLLYYLDKAVQHGSIPMDVYLRQVRNLAREQFFLRATCEKVQEAQTHIQVSKMAARYAV